MKYLFQNEFISANKKKEKIEGTKMKQLNKESRATRLLAAIIFGTKSKLKVYDQNKSSSG